MEQPRSVVVDVKLPQQPFAKVSCLLSLLKNVRPALKEGNKREK